MRIAILAPSAPPLADGGIAISHFHLARQLRKNGHEVKIFTFADNPPKKSFAEIDPGLERRFIARWWVKLCRAICAAVFLVADGFRPGLSYQTSDILKIFWAVRSLGPVIKSFAPQALIVPDQALPHLFLSIPVGCRVIQICHHNPMRFLNVPYLPRHSPSDAKFAHWLESKALRKVNAVVTPSVYMANYFRSSFPASLPPNIIYTPIQIDIPNDPILGLRKAIGLPNGAPIFYIPSAGSPVKGSALLPELLWKMEDRKTGPYGFYFSGEVPGIEHIRSVTSASIYSPGKLPNREHLNLVRECDVCLSPTLVENFSIALLEAKMAGLTIATFDVGGNSEIVREAADGETVPFLDLDRLANAAWKLATQPKASNPAPGQDLISQYLEVIRG